MFKVFSCVILFVPACCLNARALFQLILDYNRRNVLVTPLQIKFLILASRTETLVPKLKRRSRKQKCF